MPRKKKVKSENIDDNSGTEETPTPSQPLEVIDVNQPDILNFEEAKSNEADESITIGGFEPGSSDNSNIASDNLTPEQIKVRDSDEFWGSAYDESSPKVQAPDHHDSYAGFSSDNLEIVEDEHTDPLPAHIEPSDNIEIPGMFGHGDFVADEPGENISTGISDNSPPSGIVGIPEDQLDLYEEVGEEEEEEVESDNPLLVEEEEQEQEPEEEEQEEVITTTVVPPLQQINQERALQRKYNRVAFLTEYSKNTKRTYDNVATKLGISPDTGMRYMREYIEHVKTAKRDGVYPQAVFNEYNRPIKEPEKRLLTYHINSLKDIVLKYGNFVVEEAQDLNTINAPSNISNNSALSSSPIGVENLSLLDGPAASPNNSFGNQQPQPQPQQQNKVFDNGFNDIDHLYYGITPLQLIRFGIINVTNSTQTADRISQLMGGNVDRYIQSEADIKGLLAMGHFGAAAEIDRFIAWLKMNAHYLAVPSGFLAIAAGQPGQNMNIQGQGMGMGMGQNFGFGQVSNTGEDPMYQFYVAQGIYINGLPSTHPVNVERLKQYEDRKNEEEQMKSMERKFNMFMRAKMLEMFDSGNKNQGGFGELFNNPMLMMMLGLGEMQVVNNPDGTQTTKLVPKIGGAAAGQQANQPNQTTEVMSMFKEMVGFMTALQGQQGGAHNSIMEQILPIMINKLTEKPPNQMQEMLGVMEFVDKIKGQNPQQGGFQAIPPDVLIQQKRMELDQQFAMRRFDLEEKKLGMEQQRLVAQDKEAHENVNTLMGGVKEIGPVLLGVLQQFMGSRMPGGAPGGVPGGLMPGAPVAGAGQPGGLNPAELIMRMEYEKQMRREQEERERKEREWKEEQRMKNAYGQIYPQPQPTPPQQVYPQPTDATATVNIDDGSAKQQPNAYEEEEPEVYDESYFRGKPLNDILMAKAHAERERNRLETYLSSAEAVIQETLLNNETSQQLQPQPQPQPQPQIVPQPPQPQPQPQPQLSGDLDLPADLYDPDYDGGIDDNDDEGERVDIEKDIKEDDEGDNTTEVEI